MQIYWNLMNSIWSIFLSCWFLRRLLRKTQTVCFDFFSFYSNIIVSFNQFMVILHKLIFINLTQFYFMFQTNKIFVNIFVTLCFIIFQFIQKWKELLLEIIWLLRNNIFVYAIMWKFHDFNKKYLWCTMDCCIFVKQELNMTDWYNFIRMTVDHKYFGFNWLYETDVGKVVFFKFNLWW